MNKKIAIIGMGHMGKAFYEGLVFSGVKKENILTSDNSEESKKIAANADYIVLALKPSIVTEVIAEIKDIVTDKILISVAAAVTLFSLEKSTGNVTQKIIRLMPNLPVAYGKGVIGFYSNQAVSDQEKDEVSSWLSGLGTVINCKEENDLEAITVLSGSGPAVVAYFISLLEKSGESFGLDQEAASKIANQTFVGTLELLKQTKLSAQSLQELVATKGGVTETIISTFDTKKIPSQFVESLEQGYAKIKRIKDELEDKK